MSRDDDAGVLTITLHTDGGSLVMDETVHAQLGPAFRAIDADANNRIVVVTGAGDAFCAEAAFQPGSFGTPADVGRFFDEGRLRDEALYGLSIPVIAAVNGACTVHAENALFADIVIASEDAVFGDYHWGSGLIPGGVSAVAWQEALGGAFANLLLLTGGRMTAQEAKRRGLVAEVVPRHRLLERAYEHAYRLADLPDAALRFTRLSMNRHIADRVRRDAAMGYVLGGIAALDANNWQPNAANLTD
ncbi:MAG: crotonase [Mycobacterium sp.]|nr:MAG: crotonase [Mycobacterium sp.]PJE02098.1 MAG: crotonase [Mycobacterium sp.]PJE21749.1 MAG: crotonase [Mycobacterium sp.]